MITELVLVGVVVALIVFWLGITRRTRTRIVTVRPARPDGHAVDGED